MARYIDADIAIEKMKIWHTQERLIDCVRNTPTADVVKVVRCKDCLHRDPEDKKCDCSFQARGGIFPMEDDDFCSYGERRKEDAEIH